VQRQEDMKLWFMWQIVLVESKELRGKLLEVLVKTVLSLLEFRNYFSATYVLAALRSPEVTSLKKSWAILPPDCPKKMFGLRKTADQLRTHQPFYTGLLPLESRFGMPCIPPLVCVLLFCFCFFVT
jgi:RasGEF domain